MIKHIVCWKLKDQAEGREKAENALKIKELIENLKAFIPEIISIEVGINAIGTPVNNWDVVLYSKFADMKALEKYQTHPEHLKVVEFVKKVVESRVCVDY